MKAWLVAGLTAALLLPVLAFASNSKAERHYESAMKLAERGRFVDAERELKVALALEPDNLLYKTAAESVEQGKVPGPSVLSKKESAGQVSEAVAPDDKLGLAKKKAAKAAEDGRAAYRLSKLNEAAEAWRRALVLDPSNAKAKSGLARLALEEYRRDSDQPFDQTISELYDAALREMRKERFVEAKAKLEEALKLNPTQSQVKRMMAEVETAAMVQQSERSAEALCDHGSQMLREENLVEARLAFERANELDPSAACSQEGLAQQKRLAVGKVAQLIRKGRKAEKQGRADQAQGWYAEALDLIPGHKEAQEGLSRASKTASSVRKQAQRREEATGWYNRGVEAWEAGRLADAAAAFRKVTQLNPDDKDAPKALKKVRQRLDAQAGEDAREAGKLFEQGKELESRGQLQEAMASYKKALARDPSHADAKKASERLEGELKN